MARCLISFGANIGDAARTIECAAQQLEQRLGCTAERFGLSRLYRTPPVGGPSGQPPFVNAVAAAETEHSHRQIWEFIRDIESHFGRRRNRRWEARRLDLDILLYDDLRVWTSQLKIPHPRMCMRRFILIPAAEVAPDWLDPVSQWSISQLADNLQHGPGNLLLLGSAGSSADDILVQACSQAVAQRLEFAGSQLFERIPATARWAAWVPMTEATDSANVLELPNFDLPTAKLRVWLTPSDSSDDGAKSVSWEQRHHAFAQSLRLADGAVSELLGSGPRYLLDGEDPSWAAHELVAALEAMDCPVEPLA